MSNYTKGEWKANKSLTGDWIVSTDTELICREARHYNIHLIASAPLLYEACCQALRTFEAHGIRPSDPRYLMLKQSLAKAEGR